LNIKLLSVFLWFHNKRVEQPLFMSLVFVLITNSTIGSKSLAAFPIYPTFLPIVNNAETLSTIVSTLIGLVLKPSAP
jgi:hypothetical protein